MRADTLENSKEGNGADEHAPMQRRLMVQQFDSFEAMNEADAKEMAAIPPIGHLRMATTMIKKVYRAALTIPMDKTLRFRK